LGTKEDIDEILRHPFLATITESDLVGKKIEPPFKPKLSSDLLDVSCFDSQFTSEEAINSVIPIQKLDQIKKHRAEFDGFA
jgi:hypothetical protein